MKDSLGRKIEYLRLSLTQRCNLACVYCRQGYMQSFECTEIKLIEAEMVTDCMLELGINKLRLTGGEPLLRPDLEDIVFACAKRLDDVCLTTNAQGLAQRAAGLRRAGLRRVNISLDSLNEKTYERMTRGGSLKPALAGVHAALEQGLNPVKLNCVLVRGINDAEIDDFIGLTRNLPLHVRFIELMPMGGLDANMRIDTADILSARPWLYPIEREKGAAAHGYRIEGHEGKIGFISPMTKRFCHECSRVRVTSDMKLKPCLGNDTEYDLRAAIKENRLKEVIEKGIYNKPEGHGFNEGKKPKRGMNRVGG